MFQHVSSYAKVFSKAQPVCAMVMVVGHPGLLATKGATIRPGVSLDLWGFSLNLWGNAVNHP
jgi:hypothetical protein